MNSKKDLKRNDLSLEQKVNAIKLSEKGQGVKLVLCIYY